jgi:uncharacterized membrane-anchored protein YhcB (DUF1043 family)
METKNYSKTSILLVVISLIVGFILGAIVFSTNALSFKKQTKDVTEITILNKEINNCIDQLNNCENKITDSNFID